MCLSLQIFPQPQVLRGHCGGVIVNKGWDELGQVFGFGLGFGLFLQIHNVNAIH